MGRREPRILLFITEPSSPAQSIQSSSSSSSTRSSSPVQLIQLSSSISSSSSSSHSLHHLFNTLQLSSSSSSSTLFNMLQSSSSSSSPSCYSSSSSPVQFPPVVFILLSPSLWSPTLPFLTSDLYPGPPGLEHQSPTARGGEWNPDPESMCLALPTEPSSYFG